MKAANVLMARLDRPLAAVGLVSVPRRRKSVVTPKTNHNVDCMTVGMSLEDAEAKLKAAGFSGGANDSYEDGTIWSVYELETADRYFRADIDHKNGIVTSVFRWH